MKVIVKPHNIQVISTPVNELELNVTKVEFEFSEEITNDFVKEAYFTLDDSTYKKVIVNNECDIPSEVLTKVGTVELGVVAYLVEDEEEIVRYNPKPGYFTSWEGSLKDAENSEPITPSEMEQYEQALQDGLGDISDALTDLQNKVDSGYFDGQDGTNGITPTIGNNGNWYLGDADTGKPSRGATGATGQTGQTGPAGRDGTDGVSPTATVTKSGSTATITITDKNGTTTTTINDGVNGTNGTNGRDGAIQYTAGDNITIENNVISATGGDLSNYYTKSETNSLIHDSGDAKIYEFKVSGNIVIGNNTSQINITDTNDKARMGEIITNGYKYGLTGINLRDKTVSSSYFMGFDTNLSTKPTTVYFQGFIFPTVNSTSAYHIMDAWIQVTGTWSGDVFTCTALTINFTANNSGKGYITTWQNENAVTPTSDYHPATKKYVDDTISNKIWIGTQTEYDNLSSYSNNTVYFIKES